MICPHCGKESVELQAIWAARAKMMKEFEEILKQRDVQEQMKSFTDMQKVTQEDLDFRVD